MVLTTLLFTVITIIFSNQIEEYLGIPKGIIYFVALYAMYQNVAEVLLSLWRMEDKAVLYGIFRVSRTILEISIALILIVIFGETFNGSITALAYSYGIASLVVIYILIKRKILIPEIKKKHIRYLISYGVPLIPHVLGAVIIMNSDKIVLTAYKGLSSNGIYSVGFMVGQGIGLLQNSFNQAWAPFVYDKLKNGNFSHKLRIVKYTYIYFVAILIVSIVFYLFTPIIFNLLGKNFSSGQSLVLWIAIGFAFNGMYKMVSVYFFYEEKTGQIALITIFTSLINIGFLLLLVPKYDEFGAAISTMISMFIQFILTWAMSTRITKMPWNLKSI
jgi:O-antigen/teichoic acid export membrane protein